MTSRRKVTIAANNVIEGDFVAGRKVVDIIYTGGKVHFELADGERLSYLSEQRISAEFVNPGGN